MPQLAAQRRLVSHMEHAHNIQWSETREAIEDGEPATTALSPAQTATTVQADFQFHPEKHSRPEQIPIIRLSFELLPPGSWTTQQVIDHYCKLSRSYPNGPGEPKFDHSRIERIVSLGAIRCWIGKEAWRGYHVFEFANSNRVVLECPFTGNATYVLWGTWKEMLSLTKAEIRTEYRHLHTKVIHRGDWLRRIRDALRKGRSETPQAIFVKA
jgi:hypothetical protein